MYILYFYIYLISTSLLASLCMLAFALTRRAHNQSIIVNRVCLFGVIIDKPFGSSFFIFIKELISHILDTCATLSHAFLHFSDLLTYPLVLNRFLKTFYTAYRMYDSWILMLSNFSVKRCVVIDTNTLEGWMAVTVFRLY